MVKKSNTAVKPTRAEDFPQWYQEVIKAADLAEHSPVRGCMIIKPWGYAVWENIQKFLDTMIKNTGHKNFYFPMFVPLSYLAKEAKHIEGFAKECAVVTHHRLETNSDNELIPSAPLNEALIIRPTSEAVIGEAYARWIQSYRDLPILGNQWANVVRWEMRPRIFLRTTEFLWQEGHTAHAEAEEAVKEAETMLEVYRVLIEEFLAIPVVLGKKTANEKFPGAEVTYCLEAMMQDGKALQAGTSHFLGQNFAKAFNIKFLDKNVNEQHVWTTSWGVSSRLIGGMIMTHSDDDGLVLPPRLAPEQIVIIPLIHKEEDRNSIIEYCQMLQKLLLNQKYDNNQIKVLIDLQEGRIGDKIWGWVKKGVPLRLEIGKKELASQQVFCGRRDYAPSEKFSMPYDKFIDKVAEFLQEIQNNLFLKAQMRQKQNSFYANNAHEFYEFFNKSNGFVYAYWIGDDETEALLKQELKVTARCIPLDSKKTGTCIFTNQPDAPLTVFARAY